MQLPLQTPQPLLRHSTDFLCPAEDLRGESRGLVFSHTIQGCTVAVSRDARAPLLDGHRPLQKLIRFSQMHGYRATVCHPTRPKPSMVLTKLDDLPTRRQEGEHDLVAHARA